MNWEPATATTPKPSAKGPNITARMGPGGRALILSVNARAQDEYFGESIVGVRFAIDWAYENGLPHLRIALSSDGSIVATKFARGGARLSVSAFGSGLPDDKTVSAPCTVVELREEDGALILAMPETLRLPAMPPRRPKP